MSNFWRRGQLKPWCATCQRVRVKGWKNRYCSAACVPRAVRAANCRKSRATFAYRRRAVFFAETFARMTEGRQRMTKEAVLDAFMAVYRRGYENGYHQARRQKSDQAA